MRVDEFRRTLEEVAGPEPETTSADLVRVRGLARRRRARRAVMVVAASAVAVAGLTAFVVALQAPSDDSARVSAGGQRRPRTTGVGPAIFLLAEGNRVTRVDLGTGKQRTVVVPGLVGGDPPFHLLVRGDRLVYWGRTENDGEFATFSIPLDLRGPPQLLDRALIFVPSTHPDRVWLVYDTNGDRRPAVVREVTATGVETVPRTALPPGSYPDRGVDDGLLLERNRKLEVWRPGVGAVRAFSTGPSLDANASTVAWVSESDDGRLHVAAVDTGAERVYAPRTGTERFLAGALSPDGRTLAALVGPSPGPQSTGVHARLALVDLASGNTRLVAGSKIAPYGNVAWSPDGRVVIFTGYVQQPRLVIEVGTYEVGAPAARRISVPTAHDTRVTAAG